MSGVTVSNYVSTSENGVLIVGVPESPIQNVLISNAEMTLRNLTGYPGGFMDLRPGILGMRADVNDSGIYTEYVNNLELQNVSVRPSLSCSQSTQLLQRPGLHVPAVLQVPVSP